MINKRILITGGTSRFANKLKKHLFGKNIIYTTRKQLDILNEDSIERSINKYKPHYLIHLASLSRPMDIHVKKINLSIDTNIIGTANIVKKCAEKNIKLIFFSSNYVYPGKKGNYTENDGVLPINNYAWSKLGGEASVILYKNSLILRLAMTEKPFIHKEAFTDAKANFLYQEQVAKVIPKILDEKGILNIGSKNVESMYDFAKKTKANVKKSSIKKVKYFPEDSSVNIGKLEKLISRPKNNKIKLMLAAGPSITSLEKNVVNHMMENGWDNYEYVEKFEKDFANYHGRKFCLMTPSCTLAIYLTLKSLGIKKGDEIIVPDSTWTASVSPIVELGAIPIFIDADKKNWCIDINLIEEKITNKTKAILCVDLFGNMTDMRRISKICKKKKLFFLEDSAEALGSEFQKIKAGKFGDVSFHSFHRTKTITSGEGGVLLTDNKKIYNKAKFLRDLGRSKNNTYYAEATSLKFMPSNLQASMAYAQFQRIDELLSIKRRIYKNYKRELKGMKIQFNLDNKKIKNGFWATVINFDSKYKVNVTSLLKYLSKYKIFARPFFMPLSSQKAYRKFTDKKNFKKNQVSKKLFQNSIVLPSHYNLTVEDINFIAKKIKKFVYKSIS
jgi:perosamine synthetase